MRKLLGSFLLIFFILCLSLNFISCSMASKDNYSSTKEEDYTAYISEVTQAEKNMPQIEDLGNYKNIFIGRQNTFEVMFFTDSIVVIVEYEESSFCQEVQKIEENYRFLSNETEELQQISANVHGFQIKTVKQEQVYTICDYPKYFLMIGIDEQNKAISYLYHYDSDLDYIDDLGKFIKKYYNFG